MILPSKHITVENSLLGSGARILELASEPLTVVGLWERARESKVLPSFSRFVLTLDFLYAISAIEFAQGLIVKSKAK